MLALIDYGAGNLRSVENALRSAGAVNIAVTADPALVRKADRIVLPGVGAFGACMGALAGLEGMIDTLHERVVGQGAPFLGICVGMQLMAERGLEHRTTRGLGWIAGDVVAIEGEALKIPHMGWNDLEIRTNHPVLAGIETGAHAYFVHSYRFACAEPRDVLANVEYGEAVTAAIGRDNLVGTQFHPEKSQATGLRLIGNFLRWRP